jgi:hypothetical protein
MPFRRVVRSRVKLTRQLMHTAIRGNERFEYKLGLTIENDEFTSHFNFLFGMHVPPFQICSYKSDKSARPVRPLRQDLISTSAHPSRPPETHLRTGNEWVEGA